MEDEDDLPAELLACDHLGAPTGFEPDGHDAGGPGSAWWARMAGATHGRWEARGSGKVFVLSTGVELAGQEGYKAYLKLKGGGGGWGGRGRGRGKRKGIGKGRSSSTKRKGKKKGTAAGGTRTGSRTAGASLGTKRGRVRVKKE